MSRKLDVAIARALGYEVEDRTNQPTYVDFWTQKGDLPWYKVPEYSSDGNAMLELDTEMRERGWQLTLWQDTDIWVVAYEKQNITPWVAVYEKIEEKIGTEILSINRKATGEAMPEAVALAAYYALTEKEWQEP